MLGDECENGRDGSLSHGWEVDLKEEKHREYVVESCAGRELLANSFFQHIFVYSSLCITKRKC